MAKGVWKKRYLEAVKSKRGVRAKAITAPQEVLDKNIPKPSGDEINSIVESLYNNSVWEKEPGVYAKAMEAAQKPPVSEK